MVPDRREVARQQPSTSASEAGVQGRPVSAASSTWGPHRARRHAAVGRAQFSHRPAMPFDNKRGDDGRDVLVEPLGQLVGGELPSRREQGNANGRDDLAGRQRGLAIAGDERRPPATSAGPRARPASPSRRARSGRQSCRRSEKRSRDCRRSFRDCGFAASRCGARARRRTGNAGRGGVRLRCR